MKRPSNVDEATVKGFGQEWSRFPQNDLGEDTLRRVFDDYFRIFPWDRLPPDGGVGADIGCGSGRWAVLVAPRVQKLILVDASEAALGVARRNAAHLSNVEFLHQSVGDLSFDDGSLDFAYSLGVLHHVPDTAAAIRTLAAKLKPGAPLLLYLYYAFDNRPAWYRGLWRLSDMQRRWISRLPFWLRFGLCQLVALAIYWPLARSAWVLGRVGWLPASWPLGWYCDKPLAVMRTDALDRLGTVLEKRFGRQAIARMMESAGLTDIRFSAEPPFWIAVGLRAV